MPHLHRSLEESFRRLQTDYVDLYQLHGPDPEVLDSEELLEALRGLKQAGKIRAYGISLDGAEFCLQAVAKWQPDAIQILFNLFNLEPEACFHTCKETGTALHHQGAAGLRHARRQLGGGDDGEVGRSAGALGGRGDGAASPVMSDMRFLIEGTGRTWSQASLQFVLSFGAVSTVIPGTTSIAHLEENVAAAGQQLSHDEIRRLHGLMGGDFVELNLGW